jgi:hypothetical protein
MDLSTAQTHLDTWLAAELKVAAGQSYQIDGRSLTRADLTQIAERIAYWRKTVIELTAESGGARSPGIRRATWA